MRVRFCRPSMKRCRLGVTVRSCSTRRAVGLSRMPCENVFSRGVAICVISCTCIACTYSISSPTYFLSCTIPIPLMISHFKKAIVS